MKKNISLLVVLSLFLSSCCTVVNGRYDEVDVRSSVPGSSVFVDGVEKAKTPCTVEVKRSGSHSLEVQKKGYHPYKAELKQTGSWWLLGNVLIGGLIGIAVDLCTGAYVDIMPDEVDAQLTPVTVAH